MLAAEAQIPAGKKLKIGYIGRGSVSHAYLPTLADADFIELVSICDLIEDRAKDAQNSTRSPTSSPTLMRCWQGRSSTCWSTPLQCRLTTQSIERPSQPVAMSGVKSPWRWR